ncbi:MAG: DUF805 domain-containing protein [Prevotella sp.]|nr:DUF805 domain-containing protein [Prevotella sp.]
MGFFGSIKSVLGNYVNFSGRARRSEYWWWVLFNILWCWIPIVNILLGLAFFLPSLAVAIRRLHDTGRSGWWILLGLIPVIGGLVLLIFYCTDSQLGENQYGPNPKGIGNAAPAAEPAPAAASAAAAEAAAPAAEPAANAEA